MKKYWFKTKQYGWRWYPTTWQGWAILFLFILIVIANFYIVDSQSHSASDTLLNFIPETLILTILLILVCYLTREKPRWRWGEK